MLDVVHMWNDEVEAFYNEQIVNQKRIYSQRFDIVTHCHISPSDFPLTCSVQPSGLSLFLSLLPSGATLIGYWS